MSSEGYRVFKVQSKIALPDPAFSETRYHTALFIEMENDGSGRIHQVTGDIVSASGMTYEFKHETRPEDLEAFHAKFFLGWVRKCDYPDVFDGLLRSIPPPPRQRRFNITTMAYEQCRPDGSGYEAGEPIPPYEKCTEWTNKKAIPALKNNGLLHASLD